MKVRRHPIMGFFAGLLFGLGVALMLFMLGVVPMTVMWLAICTVGGIVLGVALAYAVPARRAKDAATRSASG